MRLLLILLVTAAVSLGAGWAASTLASMMPCVGERLSCNINDALGAYSVLIWSAVGPLAYGIVLLFARNRISLGNVALVLLAPLVIFISGALIEAWQTIGAEPYKNFREVMSVFVPPATTVAAQWFMLRSLLGTTRESALDGAGADAPYSTRANGAKPDKRGELPR